MDYSYAKYATDMAVKLLSIDSPTGYTDKAIDWVINEFTALGYSCKRTIKGGAFIDFGGDDTNDALMLDVHADTLGCMVREIKGNGRLKLTSCGGLYPESIETENARIYTRDGRVYTGTFQINNASVHVNDNFKGTPRDWNNCELVLDEDVRCADDTRKLGIENGDFVCFDPRTVVTEKGYIKSRFLDDKLSVGILFGFAKYMKDEGITPRRRLYGHVTVYEEVGHGASATVPEGVTEALSIDMGCVGDGIVANEKMVSICCKDGRGPYNYDITTRLINAAKSEGADYAVDFYPHYGSDVEDTLIAGFDIRHGLIGAGVYASHGYERSHIDGVFNTLKTLKAFALA